MEPPIGKSPVPPLGLSRVLLGEGEGDRDELALGLGSQMAHGLQVGLPPLREGLGLGDGDGEFDG
ncbi:hypothetical protein ACFWAX_34160, partial [Streptomyces sp. NPDC059956]|uniref:hypothetical protein n=1 Tax=Streptomyces sp. NPDC059956 TaxID=3347015 RepID=UPI0036684C9F